MAVPERLPMLFTLSLLLLVCLFPASSAAQDDDRVLRIRLMEQHQPRALTVRAVDGDLTLMGRTDAAPLAHLEDGEAARVRLRNGELQLTLPQGVLYALEVHLVPEAAFEVEITDGANPPGPRSYPGSLAITPTDAGETLQLINHADLEAYVACVVGREYGFDDLEGAKAMAVLTRTYALRSAGKFGEAYDHVDHVSSQVYEGLERRTATSLAAAKATAGEVLAYQGDLVEAVYFASSGGHTADNEAVWDAQPLPYLRGKPDPYDAQSPYASWEATIDRTQLLDLLSRTYGFEADGFLIADRSRDGRVQTVELLRNGDPHTVLRGNEFRLLVNRHFGTHTLRSTLFKARRQGNYYIIEGNGFGHGVGLSQYGALELSRRGTSYQDILGFYFTGVQLASLDDMDEAVPPLDAVIRPAAESIKPPPKRTQAPSARAEHPSPSEETATRRIGW